MKVSNFLYSAKSFSKYLFVALSIFSSLQAWSMPENVHHSSPLILSNVTGNIWIETDANSTYNGETGPSGVLVYLVDNEEDTIVSEALTVEGKYEFNGINAGKYYLIIHNSAFDLGGPLSGQQSCIGVNDANDMVDDDDNGTDTTPNDVLSSSFNLTNTDPMNVVSIEYVDFCFNFVCEDQNQITSTTCGEISDLDIICDINALDNYCSVLPADSSAGVQPMPLCNGFSNSENISWFSFVGAEGSYNLRIDAFDCQTGNLGQQGIQVGIYTDCSFSEPVFCSNLCTTDPIGISSSVLISGQVYYLYINGCNGNVCNYQIDIDGEPMIPSLEPEDVCIFSGGAFQCEDLSYCPNADIIFEGRGLNFTGDFNWSITTLSGAPYGGDPNPITNTKELVINFPAEGIYEVCLTKVENGCVDQTWSGTICRTVTTTFSIPMPMDEDFGEYFVCADDVDDFSVAFLAGEDPNGDGDSGWNALPPDYMVGLNQGIAYTDGCSYEQQFTLFAFAPSPVEDVLISICEEDLPIQVDGIIFTSFSFGGQLIFQIDNFLLQNSEDQNGCDSIINLTLEKLDIVQGFIEEPICIPDGISMNFNYISDLSTDISFIDFVWIDPNGNILPNGADPTSIIAPFSSGSGDYTLEATINKNGVSCSYIYFAFIDIASFLPPIPIILGQNIVCSGESSVVYSLQGGGDEIAFIWSFPNDVASAIISGATNEILTIDWTGSNGGQITAIGQNICGQSDQASFDVQVIPKTTPNFLIDTSICIDNPATIIFIGSNLNIVTYTWDFDGGSILSGSGMGPYEVTWDAPGEKFVSLVTTDINGCLSNQTIKSIPVKEPLVPTQVTCAASVGEVIFTWEIPLMVSGFEVNVLTGQTGGIFTATSFSISGLAEGETVTIELFTKPEDPICGEFVSTIVSCTAQDCIAPQIELVADQNVCANDGNITISATITTGETGTGTFSGPGIIDAANGVFDPSSANIGVNFISYTFTGDNTGCIGSNTISIEVFDVPISSFTQDLDTMCITDEVSLSYDGTVNTDSFDWDFDGGVGSGLLTNQKVVFASPGVKNISLQVTNDGCISNIFTSTILVEPELENLLIQCDTASTDFVTFSWNNIVEAFLFEIVIDNNPPFFTSDTSIIIDDLEEEQEVTISVTSLSTTSCPGSTSSSMCTTTKTPVSTENQALANVYIYPNPAQNLLFIEGVLGNDLSFDLYSVIGSSIKKGDVKANSIDLSNVASGIYMLRLTDETSRLYKDFKIVKE